MYQKVLLFIFMTSYSLGLYFDYAFIFLTQPGPFLCTPLSQLNPKPVKCTKIMLCNPLYDMQVDYKGGNAIHNWANENGFYCPKSSQGGNGVFSDDEYI